jgi:speckle-type POZ protein
MQGRPIDFHFHEFRLDYEQTKHLAVGKAVYSDPFSAGGHMWKIKCFPRGNWSSNSDEHLSVFVELENQPRLSVSAIFEVFLMDKDVHLFQMEDWGWSRFVTHIDLVENHVKDGHIRIICGIMVVNDRSIPVPPLNIVEHLGTLLDIADGADVSFIVGNETFHTH